VKPLRYDLTIYRGATFDQPLLWKPGGTPQNLTGWSARMQVRATVDSATVIVELTTANNRIVLGTSGDLTTGAIRLLLSATDTSSLPLSTDPAGHVYDLELVGPGGIVERLVEGRVIVSPEVTR
jgi:hypothetical protein